MLGWITLTPAWAAAIACTRLQGNDKQSQLAFWIYTGLIRSYGLDHTHTRLRRGNGLHQAAEKQGRTSAI